MLNILAPEIVALIFSNIDTVPDLLSLRLVSRVLAARSTCRLFEIAFKHIRLPLDDPDRLISAADYVNNSTLSSNICYITISGLHDLQLLQHDEQTLLGLNQSRSSDNTILEPSVRSLEHVLACLVQRRQRGAYHEIRVDFGVQALLHHLEQTTSNSDTYRTAGSSWRQYQLSRSACTTTQVLDFLTLATMRMLRSWEQALIHISTLELDGAVLSLMDIENLAHAIMVTGGIKRLSLRLHERTIEPEILLQSVSKSVQCLVNASCEQLEELVLSSVCNKSESTKHDLFLESFMNAARYKRLCYVYFDGFSIDCTTILRFLERHKTIIKHHAYNNFSFDGLDYLGDEEFETAFNHELQIRGLCHLSIGDV